MQSSAAVLLKSPFFEQVHEGAGDPEAVAMRDNKIVDVCVLAA